MMLKKLPDGRFRVFLSVLGLCLVIGLAFGFSEQVSSNNSLPLNQTEEEEGSSVDGAWTRLGEGILARTGGDTGTLEKMNVSTGTATMTVDTAGLNGSNSAPSTLQFTLEQDGFFTILVFDNELRGPMPSSIGLVAQNSRELPTALSAADLALESLPWGGDYDLVIRDRKTGGVIFNIEGNSFDYDAAERLFSFQRGRLLLSPEFAAQIGRASEAGAVIGEISIAATMRAIEVTHLVNGETRSATLPAVQEGDGNLVPGPDVIVGELTGLAQFDGSFGGRVGLAIGTDACNAGVEPLHWFANPNNDHPVIPQNLYRMSGGATNNERFEQIGQSSVKHAFTALQNNICNFGCQSSGTGTLLGAGCSDPYGAGLNSGPGLGSRAWINPFTGFFPTNSSTNNNHSGHNHNGNGTAHRILTEITDLNTTLNQGASYFSEAQYITPHEYAWCQLNPGQCNQYNNVSYRKYNVSGTGSPFSFSQAGPTVRTQPAINAWTGATRVEIRPDPGNDGIGFVAYKVTNPSADVWHYEYAIYNQNLDRAIQSFRMPVGSGVTLSNVGFHAPPQHPGWTFDGTVGNTGYSSAPWVQAEAGGFVTWTTETFVQNPNANAIRWGTLYNIRFDSNRPPMTTNATIGFFKTGAPMSVQVQGPSNAIPTCSRLPTGNRCS